MVNGAWPQKSGAVLGGGRSVTRYRPCPPATFDEAKLVTSRIILDKRAMASLKSASKLRFVLAVFIGTLVLGFAPKTLSQDDTDKKRPANSAPQTASRSKDSADLTEWKILLDSLAVETRTLEPEQERPLIIAELADAYWQIDKNESKKLFNDAFDRALSLPNAHKPGHVTASVLAIAARRDRTLAMSLTNRLMESPNKGSASGRQAWRVARDLVESDINLAVELAQAAASFGPSMSGLWFLFQVAEKDPAAAEKLYDVYFKQLIATRSPDLSSVLWLAGYPLGYGEAYGGSIDPVSFTGFGGLRTPGLNPHPTFARAYLQLAFASITDTLRKAATANDVDRDVLNSLVLFSAAYLFPEVQRYLPDAEGAWSNIYRQAQTGTTNERRAAVEKRLQSMLEVRARTSKYQSTEDYLSGDAKEKLELISKLPGGCKRDQAYAEVAFNFSYSRKFSQAQQMADRIESISLRDQVLQFVNYDIAAAAIDSGNLVEAPALAEIVAAKGQRALLFGRIAAKSLKSGNKSRVLDLLNRARVLVRDPGDPELQAGVLLAVASVYVQFDPIETMAVMRDAIKAVNHVKDRVPGEFSVLRRVDFGCEGEDRWYGGRERAETFSLYETLALLAVSEIQGQGALSLASELENRPARIRAQLSVIKAVLRTGSQAKRM